MRDCLILGGGGHAKVVISVLRKSRAFRMLGYVDQRDKGIVLGLRYLGDDDRLAELKAKHRDLAAVIAIGYTRVTEHRMTLRNRLISLDYCLPSIVSAHAIVNEGVSIGQGTVVLDGAVVNASALIGQCVIVNTNSTIEHDCVIGDSVHIAPGAILCGGVHVGARSFIGAGAQVIEAVTICNGCIVGAGSTVIRDITEPGTYVGSPARRIK